MQVSQRQANRLVLVTGAGRSGTSTVAGTLHHLGLHVPLPVLKPNESNPQGFFESTWPLWFHRRLMDIAVIEQTDGRPEALGLVARAVTPEIREEIREWLAGVATEGSQLMVKDPRSIWVPWLWEETAHDLGMTIGFLTMLRHPAEVLGSRSTYYGGKRSDLAAWKFTVGNLCGWINGNLVVERQTRGKPRVVLLYNSLVEDWRTSMSLVRETFDLTYDNDFAVGESHPVDDFIDPGLRRHEPSWEGMDIPPELIEIAEGVWQAMCKIADGAGHDSGAETQMDELSARYEHLMRVSQAVARDTALTQAKAARHKAEQETREEMAKQVAKARAAARAARAKARAKAKANQPPPPSLARRVYRGVRRRLGDRIRSRRA